MSRRTSRNNSYTSGISPSGFYIADVVAVDGGYVSVKVPRLGLNNIYENVPFTGFTPSVGDRIWVSFVEGKASHLLGFVGAGDTGTDITEIIAGLGLSGGGSGGSITVDFEPSELTTATLAYEDKVVISDASDGGEPKLVPISEVITTANGDGGEPIGHEDKSESVISFDHSTRTFTIAPVGDSYVVWCAGQKFVKTASESVVIGSSSDLYYISFDADGVLQATTTFYQWDSETPTAYIHYNSGEPAKYMLFDERHGIVLDWQTHEYLHRTRGAAIANGFDASNFDVSTQNGSTDDQAYIDIADGTFFDEDLQVDIVHSNTPTANTWEQDLQGPAQIPVFYQSGTTGWTYDAPTNFPLKYGGTPSPTYNLNSGGTWSTPEITSNNYGISWIVATNQLNYPVIAIMGQDFYTNLGDAEAVTWDSMNLDDLPVVELRVLYKVVYRASGSNTPGAYFVEVDDYRRALSSATSTAAAVVDHGNLTGLGDDDHTQYLLVDGSRSATNLFVSDASSFNVDVTDSTYVRIGNTSSSADEFEMVSLGSMDFVIDSNDNSTGKTFQWVTNGGKGAGTTLMTLTDLGVLTLGSDRVLTVADEGTGNGLDADTVDGIQASSFLRSDVADTATGQITFTGNVVIDNSTVNTITLYTEAPGAKIADTFTDNTTYKSYISFSAGSNSNDPGYIMHETSNLTSPDERNEGVLHIVPSDDNQYGDYVSIHGTNDPDSVRIHTNGAFEGVASINGLGIHSGRNNEVNKIVRTDGSGYIQAGWINTTSGGHSGTVNRIYASNDAYIRYMTPANFRASVTDGVYAAASHSHSYISTSSTQSSNLYIRNSSPTIYMRDTDHRAAMLHQNSHIFYVLRASGNDSTTWQTTQGEWPLVVRVDNNEVVAGGQVRVPNMDGTGSYNTVRYNTSNGHLMQFTSLAEYKTDVVEINAILGSLNERSLLHDLRPILFHEDQETANTRGEYIPGFIAEEVHEVAPELTYYDKNGELISYSPEALVPHLVAEIQRLNGMVEELYQSAHPDWTPPQPRPLDRGAAEKAVFDAGAAYTVANPVVIPPPNVPIEPEEPTE